MTDRELLEMAAKACGELTPSWYGNADYFDGVLRRWNPLEDDGDALRLACALKINIEHVETLRRKIHGVNCWSVGRGDCAHMESDVTDYNAATRRAIVRAAAEIGKAMP